MFSLSEMVILRELSVSDPTARSLDLDVCYKVECFMSDPDFINLGSTMDFSVSSDSSLMT